MIIVLDERQDVARAYSAGFEREGYAALDLRPEQFREWHHELSSAEMAAVIAVVMGTSHDRMALARSLRRLTVAPIIALNDIKSLETTLDLFSNGVDDVANKPVHVRELIARIRAIGRRGVAGRPSLNAGDVRIYLDGRDPEIANEALQLPRRERRLLECLVTNRDAWLTKIQLFSQVYGEFNDSADVTVIEGHICRLRKRLKARLGYDPVESQRFLGYRFLASSAAGAGVGNNSLAQAESDHIVQ